MTIALDFDGTFDRDPKFWRDFMENARMCGHQSLIVSCRVDDEDQLMWRRAEAER